MLTTDTAAGLVGNTGLLHEHAPRTAAEAALARRSVRAYQDIPVTDEEVRRLLELTGRAPSAHNLQPWRFIVVRDQSLKGQLRDAAFNQKQVAEAPVVIAMYADMDDTLASLNEIVHPDLDADKRDATISGLQQRLGAMPAEARAQWANGQANIALGYLLLIAESEGLATSPMLGFDPDKVKTLLGIPAQATITALVAVGRAAEDGFVSHRHTVDRVASFR
ncbi:nitroreductase family protein [Gemmatimonas aurantiaca]|uniref:nitroreductase family protein n=1 Tax=Gemmatimonas aurantiaca TaxID=173480 RepID=UPI00301C6651